MTEPRPTVRALLTDDDHRLVLFERHRLERAPYLVLPGGGIEPGESELDALGRELMEELGATAKIIERCAFGDLHTRIFWCELTKIDPDKRTGHEYRDPARGAYIVRTMTLEELQASPWALYPAGLLAHLVTQYPNAKRPRP